MARIVRRPALKALGFGLRQPQDPLSTKTTLQQVEQEKQIKSEKYLPLNFPVISGFQNRQRFAPIPPRYNLNIESNHGRTAIPLPSRVLSLLLESLFADPTRGQFRRYPKTCKESRK